MTSAITQLNTYTLDAKTRLLNAINAANNTALGQDDVVFSPPGWHHDPAIDANTKVTAIASGQTAVVGEFDFYYTRQNLQALFGLERPKLQVQSWMTWSTDLLEQLATQYRVRLTESDVIKETLPVGATTFTLKAAAKSLGWYGHLEVTLVPVQTVLDERIQTTQGNIGYSDNDQQRTRAELWYGVKRVIDQTQVGQWLDAAPAVNDPLTSEMVESVRAHFGDEWSQVTGLEEDHNLFGAQIAYYGPNTSAVGVPGSVDDVVIMVRLSQYCANFNGFLILVLPEHQVRAHHDTAPV